MVAQYKYRRSSSGVASAGRLSVPTVRSYEIPRHGKIYRRYTGKPKLPCQPPSSVSELRVAQPVVGNGSSLALSGYQRWVEEGWERGRCGSLIVKERWLQVELQARSSIRFQPRGANLESHSHRGGHYHGVACILTETATCIQYTHLGPLHPDDVKEVSATRHLQAARYGQLVLRFLFVKQQGTNRIDDDVSRFQNQPRVKPETSGVGRRAYAPAA